MRPPPAPLPPPPAGLAARPLPLTRWAGPVWRIHRLHHGPLPWSGGPGRPPAGRFDSLAGRFGTLYAATDFAGAFAETVLRNPRRPLVSLSEIEARGVSTLALSAPIDLVDLTGPGLSRLGLDARILAAPYDLCGAWADALQAHPASPGGILYPSRFDPSARCIAVFDRAASVLAPVAPPVPLGEMLSQVAAVLDRYGKALDPG